MIIAVDGPSGAGKSTVCREVARRLSWRLLDTGAIYRCVALCAMERGVAGDEAACAGIAQGLDIHFVADPGGQRVLIGTRDVSREIRTFETTRCVNAVSAMAQVRAQLLGVQRRLGRMGDTIVEGRDIGSVVFPDAELKVFYTASAEARALRRKKEFEARGETFNLEEIAAQIRLRDETEYHRACSPLIRCADAVELDTSALNFEQSCRALMDLILDRKKALGL